MFEATSGCWAVPYRYRRRLARVRIPAGAILELAPPDLVAVHIPVKYRPKRHPDGSESIPGFIPCNGGKSFASFNGYALLNDGNVALLCNLDGFEVIGGESTGV